MCGQTLPFHQLELVMGHALFELHENELANFLTYASQILLGCHLIYNRLFAGSINYVPNTDVSQSVSVTPFMPTEHSPATRLGTVDDLDTWET